MARLIIPTPLRKFTENNSSLDLKSRNVKSALDELVEKYPLLNEHLFDADKNLNGFVRLYIGEDDIDDKQGLETILNESDTLAIIPAIAGGLK